MSIGSTNSKRDLPMYAEPHLPSRMNLDDLVSKRSSSREVNDGYARSRTVRSRASTSLRFERGFFSKEKRDERYDEQRRDQDNHDALH